MNLQVFVVFLYKSLHCITPELSLCHFQSRSKRNLSQKFKSCVNRPIQQIKIEKETYSWEKKIYFELNCLFAEINGQRLLITENFQS